MKNNQKTLEGAKSKLNDVSDQFNRMSRHWEGFDPKSNRGDAKKYVRKLERLIRRVDEVTVLLIDTEESLNSDEMTICVSLHHDCDYIVSKIDFLVRQLENENVLPRVEIEGVKLPEPEPTPKAKSQRQQAIEHAYEDVEYSQSQLQVCKDMGSCTRDAESSLQIAVGRYEALVCETLTDYKKRIIKERDDLIVMINEPFQPESVGRWARYNEIESYMDAMGDAQNRVCDINLELSLL